MLLPVDQLRDEFERALDRGPVVLSAPTGTGKSTQVPRWCGARGRVLVVEPRRVACRGLAQRVAEVEGCELGGMVGYSVRDEQRASGSTRILFATPGVVLQWLGRGQAVGADWRTVILDELHERRLDTDLLLALLAEVRGLNLVAMSATITTERVARHLGATPLQGGGRCFPVSIHHLAERTLLPSARGLEGRVKAAVRMAAADPGDMLVFLPGKGEIRAAAAALAHHDDLQVLELHGGLSLAEQSQVFTPGSQRRVILATNVAETSITVPGIGVVIDSGLVRRTRYHNGRGFLTLVPVAEDSAEQRTGRAGRTAPGVCYRLWSAEARLEPHTPPEIHRESLVPLVLAAAAVGRRVPELHLLDTPRAYAVETAEQELQALGVLDPSGHITERGRQLFGLPLDPWLGRLLVEAERSGCLADVIDLVAGLEARRPLFRGARPEEEEHDLRAAGCDATALIRAVREGQPSRHRLDRFALEEARSTSRRLRRVFSLPERSEGIPAIDRERLARTALAADPRCAQVARRRRGRVAWSNGGTELELARDSAVDAEASEAIAVLDSRAMGVDARRTRIIATCAMPLRLEWLVEAGLGTDRPAAVEINDGTVEAFIERVLAGKVIGRRREEPTGDLARQAVSDLLLDGRVLPGVAGTLQERLATLQLLRRLRSHGLIEGEPGEPLPEPRQWLLDRLAGLGLERGADLALLEPDDLLPEEPPPEIRDTVRRQFPTRLEMLDCSYEVEYDLERSEITLHRVRGSRQSPPPPLHYLPRFAGFRIVFRHHSTVRVLREHS